MKGAIEKVSCENRVRLASLWFPLSYLKKVRTSTGLTMAIVVWTFLVTLSRALRKPNDFAEAHWLLSYRFGFMKRGLLGSLGGVVTEAGGPKITPEVIVGLSSLVYCGLYAAFLYQIILVLRRQQDRSSVVPLVLVFASSPFVVLNAHLFGYFDAVSYLLAVVSISLVLAHRPLAAALVSSTALLVHEGYYLVGFPPVVLASLAAAPTNGSRLDWRSLGIVAGVPTVVFMAIPLVQAQCTEGMILREQLRGYLDSFDFVRTRSRAVAIWQTTTIFEFFRHQAGAFPASLFHPGVASSVLPSLLLMLGVLHGTFKLPPYKGLSLALLAVVLGPLALHTVAWDIARISSYSLGSGFLAWLVLVRTRAAHPVSFLWIMLALGVVFCNTFGRISLMDGEVERYTNTQRFFLYAPAMGLLGWMAFTGIRDYFRTTSSTTSDASVRLESEGARSTPTSPPSGRGNL